MTRKIDPSAVTEVLTQRAGGLSLHVIGEATTAVHPLPPEGELVIGRAEDAHIQIDHPSISRRHAQLRMGPPLTIEDLGSANGTRIGGRSLAPGEAVPIAQGEVIDLGSVMLIVHRGRHLGERAQGDATSAFGHRAAAEASRAERFASDFAVVHLVAEGRTPAAELQRLVSGLVRSIDEIEAHPENGLWLLLPGLARGDAERAVAELKAQLDAKGVHAQVGLALYREHGPSIQALLSAATAGGPGALPAGLPEGVVVADPAMQQLYRLLGRVAKSPISVLLLGETGVGKEVIAQAVHRLSPRASKPYLGLNCAALSATLLESELFGHEKGAFTGADRAKPGLLETADGGTVFLDEVGELPLALQAKLLRVLEERAVIRVGGLKAQPVDVRFVAATNRDLAAEVDKGAFRRDLYFRLNGISLVIPPLRERPSELLPLAKSFLARAAKEAGLPRAPELSPAAIAALRAHPWPGNIRELRNVIDRAVVISGGRPIAVEDLTLAPPAPSAAAAPPTAATAAPAASPTHLPPPRPAASAPGESSGLRGEIASIERQRILEALEQCAGNQTRAAKVLGISRRTLISRMEDFGIPRPRKR